MLKKLLILFLMLFTVQSAYSKDLKIIQITDSHFTVSEENSNSQEILQKAIKDINSIKDKSFVVFTGDNIDNPNLDDLIAFLQDANKLNCPYYVAIGNHDVSKFQKFPKYVYMYVVSKVSKSCKHRKENYLFKKDGIVFIVLDGAKEVITGTNGYYREETLKWLHKQLKKHKKDYVVIFQHFPIEAPEFRVSHETFDADGYRTILEKHNNVIAIISGHYHMNSEKMVNDVYHISSPALIDSPHEYKIIEIKHNGKNRPRIYTMTKSIE